MDKIQELHREEMGGYEDLNVEAQKQRHHHRGYDGTFCGVERHQWVGLYWLGRVHKKRKKPGDTKSNWVVKSMPQLIELFKETL